MAEVATLQVAFEVELQTEVVMHLWMAAETIQQEVKILITLVPGMCFLQIIKPQYIVRFELTSYQSNLLQRRKTW